MNRRGFLVGLVVAAGCSRSEAPKPEGATPRATAPERSRVPRVTTLVYGTRATTSVSTLTAIGVSPIALFRERLRELGYVNGTNIILEERYADGDPQRLQQLAREIVAGNPDVIVAATPSGQAGRQPSRNPGATSPDRHRRYRSSDRSRSSSCGNWSPDLRAWACS